MSLHKEPADVYSLEHRKERKVERASLTLLTLVALNLTGIGFGDTLANTPGTTWTNFPTITGSGATATIAGYPGSP